MNKHLAPYEHNIAQAAKYAPSGATKRMTDQSSSRRAIASAINLWAVASQARTTAGDFYHGKTPQALE